MKGESPDEFPKSGDIAKVLGVFQARTSLLDHM